MKKTETLKAEFVDITPELAKRWLENNTTNRPINQKNLDTIVYEMNRKNFHLTGESIKIADDCTLLDGQHRLSAIVKTGKTIKMLVVSGLPKDAFKFLDTGRKRQAADVLAIEKYANASKVAGIIKFVIRYQKNRITDAADRAVNSKRAESMIYNADVSDFMAKHGDSIYESYHYGFGTRTKITSGTYLAGLHFICKEFDYDLADRFFHSLATGADLKESSPVFMLRQILTNDLRATRKMKSLQKLALICKAWNVTRDKRTITKLTWDQAREPFPKVK